LQDPPKFTQIGIFGFENMPSGNPDAFHILDEKKYFKLFFLVTTVIDVIFKELHRRSWPEGC
jgi:hypothetical protein